MQDVEWADGHDRYVPGLCTGRDAILHEQWYQWVAETYDLTRKRVVDFGCGVGYGTHILAATAREADGFDLSPTAIDYAHAHYAADNVRFEVADLQAPGMSGSYDFVVSNQVLEHVPDVFAFASNLAAMLTPGGTAIVGTPNRLWSYERWGGRLTASSHFMEFTPVTLQKFFGCWFTDVELFFQRVDSDKRAPTTPAAARSFPGRVVGASKTFAREVFPTAYLKAATIRSQPEGAPFSAAIVPADDDPASACGIVAVCTHHTAAVLDDTEHRPRTSP